VEKTKTGLSLGLIGVAMLLIAAATGPVTAAQITVVTSASVIGNFQEQSSLTLQKDGGLIGTSENTMAINGNTTYEKTQVINTDGNGITGSTVQTDRIIVFNASDGGRMVSQEEVITGTSGSSTSDAGCGAGGCGDSVPSCSWSIVIAGSTLDVTEASVHTTSEAGINPGTLDYTISAQGINQTPGDMSTAAVGSATAYVSANIQGGGTNSTSPDSITQYHDITSVDGLFDLDKSISYSS
jgi:hypothetical protein